MRFGSTFGTHRLVEKYPTLNDATLRDTARISLRLLLEGGFRNHLKKQRMLTEAFTLGMEQIDFGNGRTIFQIGANDGIHSDPLRPFLENGQMKAVLVEPMPIAFEALSQLYRDRGNMQLVNTAVSRHGRPITLYSPHISGQELRGTLWACRSREQVVREVERNAGKRALSSLKIEETQVETATALQLCQDVEVEPSAIAALVVDTEGQDTEIVKSFLDAGALPELIFYEQLHVPQAETAELKEKLGDLGYHLQETNKDVLALIG